MSSPDHPVRFTVEGDAGILPATVATPLAVVLNELLQNAIDHAFPRELDCTSSRVGWWSAGQRRARRCGRRSPTTAWGCPTGSTWTPSRGLGLSIVRTLVDLGARRARSRSTAATAPGPRPGTVVRLDVPVAPVVEAPGRAHGPLRAGGRGSEVGWDQAVRRWRAA